MKPVRPEYMEAFEDEILRNDRNGGLSGARGHRPGYGFDYLSRGREWTVEQTMDLHPDLVKLLSKFYTEEDQRSWRPSRRPKKTLVLREK